MTARDADLPTPVETQAQIRLAEAVVARNYAPLPVVVTDADGAWVRDIEGRRYLDCLAGYSALNFGHRHPRLIAAAEQQLHRVTLTSRAFHHDRLGPFCRDLAELAGLETVLPMNTGAEAVETAIKLVRRWGYEAKGIEPGRAKIVVAADSFHGRTTTIVGFSSDHEARSGFGPFTPGFVTVPFGDADALSAAVDDETAAVLLEPIQGEAGVIVPPDGYLSAVRALTRQQDVLFVADEIQSGLGRTGTTFAVDHESVRPDVLILGKALGGGLLPVSAVLATRDVMRVIRPGSHGSTFGGNPLAAAVGQAVVALLDTGEYQERARALGEALAAGLHELVGQGLTAVRSRGLWAGIDVEPDLMSGRQLCERLLGRGLLTKDTHGQTVRLAPPLVITRSEIEWMIEQLADALADGREAQHHG